MDVKITIITLGDTLRLRGKAQYKSTSLRYHEQQNGKILLHLVLKSENKLSNLYTTFGCAQNRNKQITQKAS